MSRILRSYTNNVTNTRNTVHYSICPHSPLRDQRKGLSWGQLGAHSQAEQAPRYGHYAMGEAGAADTADEGAAGEAGALSASLLH